MIVHSTGLGDEAAEELYRRGGAFTLSLLHSALNLKTGMDLCPVTIEHLLPKVKNTLESQNYRQIPEITFETGNLTVPFMIDTEQIADKGEPKNLNCNLNRKEHKSSLLALIAVGLIIGGLLGY